VYFPGLDRSAGNLAWILSAASTRLTAFGSERGY
jgi:hypothetical protein